MKGKMKMMTFRLPEDLVNRLKEARHARRKDYVVDVIVEALEEYLARYKIVRPPKPK